MAQYKDLQDSSKPWPDDKNYFKVTVLDLDLETTYPLQFRWQYPDKTYSDWSSTLTVDTNVENVNVPSKPIVAAGYGKITITWDGKDNSGNYLTGIDRINVYINDTYYGSIFSVGYEGRLSVALSSGTYTVKFKSVTKLGKESGYSQGTTVTFANGVEEAYVELQDMLKSSASVIANPTTKQITSINTNGVTVYASTATADSGNRITMNAEGIAGWQSGSNTNNPSFAIRINQWTHSDGTVVPAGSAFFNGTIYAQGGKLVNNLSIATYMKLGANITGHGIPGASSSVDGIVLNSDNYWILDGKFKVGNSIEYLTFVNNSLTVTGKVSASTITGSTFSVGGYLTGGFGMYIATNTAQTGGVILYGNSSNTSGSIVGTANGLVFSFGDSQITMTNAGSMVIGSSSIIINGSIINSVNLNGGFSAPSIAGDTRGFKNISATTATGYPSGGSDGDIVLVRES